MQGNGTAGATYVNPQGTKFNGPAYYNFHVAQLTVGYVPDVFGLQRGGSSRPRRNWRCGGIRVPATTIALVSNVVAAAFQEGRFCVPS